MPPEIRANRELFEATLRRLRRRIWFGDFVWAVTAGVATAAVMHALGFHHYAWLGSAAAAGLVGGALGKRRTRARAAAVLERAAPHGRNAIVTAEELLRHPERASERVRERVIAHAAPLANAVPLAKAHPLWRPVGAFVATLALAVFVPSKGSLVTRVADVVRQGVGSASDGSARISITIEPPAYARLPRLDAVDPERIDALEGSRAVVTLDGDQARWRLRFGDRALPWSADASASLQLTTSGYFALEPVGESRTGGRLIPVTVTPDRAPAVTIETPARDLVVPDASKAIAVTASAVDDLALDSLELRYTKVSGTGEDFEFVEGTLPIGVTRANDHDWKGRASIALDALQLEPGDSLVYRAVAKDRRPGGAGEASSDTFFVEIAGPGQIALEGFELPPDQERYALSQQMVVLKIERLRARERTMGSEAVKEAAIAIAAEQRAVRANFIFLMGGHVEDEEVEAEQSNEIQEGRLENTARREISTAVHLMTRVEQGLMTPSTSAALPPAKSAVEALQRAFGRNRYILRTPPSRSEIDPSRRLTGALAAAARWQRDPLRAARDPKRARLDDFVGLALALANRIEQDAAVEPRAFASLAERALAVDPGSREWQQVAARLTALGVRSSAGSRADRLAALNEAVKPGLDASLAASLPASPAGAARPGALGRAWSDGRVR